MYRLAPLGRTVYGLSAPGTDVSLSLPSPPAIFELSMGMFPRRHSLAESDRLSRLSPAFCVSLILHEYLERTLHRDAFLGQTLRQIEQIASNL